MWLVQGHLNFMTEWGFELMSPKSQYDHCITLAIWYEYFVTNMKNSLSDCQPLQTIDMFSIHQNQSYAEILCCVKWEVLDNMQLKNGMLLTVAHF